MNDGNYIKLFRSFLDWEWYMDINTGWLFLHMLLKANWKEGSFKGTTVPRGSFISSIDKLSDGTGLTKDEVRTAIKHLISTNEITKQSTNKYTVFSVVNYELYQHEPKQEPKQEPNNSQAIPKLFPTIEEGKKERREESNKRTMCIADANALFETLWKLYPLKRGKDKVSDARKLKLLEIGLDEMSRAIDRYKTELEKDSDWRKPQNGSTFFNGGYVDYLDANYVPGKSGPQKKSGFNQFQQNDYNFDELEKELLRN